MPDAKRREREVAELIIDQQTGEDVTQSPYRRALARIAEMEDDAADAKDAATSRLDVAESEADRLRALLQKSKNALEQKELVCTRLRTSWREDTADLGDFDAALHSAFQDYRDDFPDGSITDFDRWLACHVECGKEMLSP